MVDFNLAIPITADGSQAVAEVDRVAGALDRTAVAERGAASAATTLEAATGKAAAAATQNAAAQGQAGQATAAAAQASQRMVVAQSNVAAAQARTSAAAASLTAAEAKLGAATGASAVEQTRAAAQVEAARARVAAAAAANERATLQLQRAQDAATPGQAAAANSTGRLEQAYKNLGFQVQDVGAQLSTVSGPSGLFRIFAQQGGQIFSALGDIASAGAAAGQGVQKTGEGAKEAGSDLDGLGEGAIGVAEKVENTGSKFGKFAAFMAGPWGAAILLGVTVLGPLVGKLIESGDAAEEQQKKLEAAAGAADSYGSAQSLLGKIIDLTTGKLKTQNQVLIQTIKLQAQANILKAQADQKTASDALADIAKPTLLENVGAVAVGGPSYGGAGGQGEQVNRNLQNLAATLAPVKSVVEDYVRLTSIAGASQDALSRGLDATIRRLDALGRSGKLAGRDLIDTKAAVLALGTTLNDQRANQQVLDALNGKGIASDLVPYARDKKPKKPKAPKKPADTDGLVNSVTNDIASLVSQFTDAPSFVERAQAAVRKLDQDIAALEKRKPPNFRELIASAQEAKGVIQANLAKPFDDFVKSQVDQLAVLRLQTQGQDDQAEALRIIIGLEKQLGPLTPARKDAVLATVEALRAEQRQLEINRQQVGMYLDSLGQIKGIVQDATTNLGNLAKAPGRLLQAFQQLQGKVLFDKLFGETFRKLEDQVKGTSVVEDASARMADAVDQVTAQTGQTTAALGDLAAAAKGAAGAVAGQGNAAGSTVIAGVNGTAGGKSLAALLAGYVGPSGPGANGNGSTTDPDTGEIVVTGRRIPSIRRNPTELFTQALGQVGTKVAGLFTNPENAAKIGASIGKFAGKGLEGAATGAAVNSVLGPLGKALGVKTSALGSQVGGAIGSFIPIPGGQIIGSIAGSLIGGLFKKTKSGSATIGNVDGSASVTGTAGNSGSYRKAASGLGGAVGDSLSAIVDQLGGDLGNFSVSIGQRKKKYVVDGSGSGRTKGGGTQSFDTAEEAQAAALRDAILDGAIKGISGAMQAALQSNSDVNKAVAEALKVQQVERFIASVGDQLKQTFDDQARNAEQRLAIARKYGLDVVAVEKANAVERTKLVDDALKQSVGGLQDFLADMASGDLFEGTGTDKRKAILDEIGSTRTKAEAGEAGAADTLAQLYRNLLATSANEFGTAGPELASDRATAAAGASAVIKAEQDRINQAAGLQQATTTAVEKVATLTDETNSLLAVQTAAIDNLPANIAEQLSAVYGGGGGGYSYGLTARNVALQ